LISTDDDTEIWLTQGGQRFDLGEVPEGRYEIQAIFSGDVIHAGDVSLRAGEQVKLRCDDYFQQCRREER
jgi:alanyl-tRNA synthetase